MAEYIYAAIDLKSFYASVECVLRGLNPLNTNLVVADQSRTDKTICLAVSPALKSFGIPGRPRLFEVIEKVKNINNTRMESAPNRQLQGKSCLAEDLQKNPFMKLEYLIVPPQMAEYVRVSTEIYKIYLKYVSPDDIHVYSIDEVFINVTPYLRMYHCTAHELVMRMIRDVLKNTGITATAGIGTNLYLAKIAMDIVAKHKEADADGVRIAELDEMGYRRQLWSHRPLTDFWQVGRGYTEKLAKYGIHTMGDIARCSVGEEHAFYNEDLLYKLFGVNAELLIDHAWGWEPCTIAMIKDYKPENNSLSSGQVLMHPYTCDKAKIVLREMAENMALDLTAKGLVTDQLVVTVGYDRTNIGAGKNYKGEAKADHYGRLVPKHGHGTSNLGLYTASSQLIIEAAMELYDRIINPELLIRRLTINANHVIMTSQVHKPQEEEQLDLFAVEQDGVETSSFEAVQSTGLIQKDMQVQEAEKKTEAAALAKEEQRQLAILAIKDKFGKNAILRGTNFVEGATGRDRNSQIGGHKA